MSPSLPRKVLVWPHPDSSGHMICSTDLRLRPLLWASYTTPLSETLHQMLFMEGRKRKWKIRRNKFKNLLLSNLLKGMLLKENLDRSSLPDSNTALLHQFHLQTWIHQFSDPSKSHLCLVSPSPRSTAVANILSAIVQATFTHTHTHAHTHTQKTRLPGEIRLKRRTGLHPPQ